MLCCVSPDPTPQFIQFAFVWAACLHLTFPYITYKRKIPSNSGSLWHYPGRWSHGNLFIGGPKGPMVVTSRFQNLKAASLDSLLLRLKRSQPSPNPSQRKWNQHLVLVVQTKGMSDSWQHCHWPRVRRCHQWAILSVVSSSLLLSHSPFGRQSQYSEVFFHCLSPPSPKINREKGVVKKSKLFTPWRWAPPVWVLHGTTSRRKKRFCNHKIQPLLCSWFGWCLFLLTSRPGWKTEDVSVQKEDPKC